MYRSFAASVILLAFAFKPQPDGNTTSDTTIPGAGPNSTAETARAGFVSTASASPVASGVPRADRVPNELGRIMVVEYRLLGDGNTTYTRDRASFRQDLELLHKR